MLALKEKKEVSDKVEVPNTRERSSRRINVLGRRGGCGSKAILQSIDEADGIQGTSLALNQALLSLNIAFL